MDIESREDSAETSNAGAPAPDGAAPRAAGLPTWGQAVRLRPALGQQIVALTPAWAALAGALAIGMAWTWAGLLSLLSAILLVEALYAVLFGPADDSAGIVRERIVWLPYSRPDSPSGRLARWWGRAGAARAGGLLVTLLLAGALAGWLGLPALWAVLALLALGGLRAALGRLWSGLGRWVGAAAGVLIPWLLAGALFGGPSEWSLAGALLYTVTRGALIDRGRLSKAPWALALAGLCQVVVLVALIALKRPIAAALFAVGLGAQVFIYALSRREADEAGAARLQLLVVAGMLLAAASVAQ